jgi:hypothetical protein
MVNRPVKGSMPMQPQDAIQDQNTKQIQQVEVPIHLDLWLKSFESNPDPNQLYTTQINSTNELLDRCNNLS